MADKVQNDHRELEWIPHVSPAAASRPSPHSPAIAVVVPATSAQADTVVASTASTAPTSPATAPVTAGGCGTRTTTQALAQFGDLNDYFPIVGGTFESGDLSHFLVSGGPFIAHENEPWRVLGLRGHAIRRAARRRHPQGHLLRADRRGLHAPLREVPEQFARAR